MSFEKMIEARLKGYKGPYFHTGILTINERYWQTEIKTWTIFQELRRYSPMYCGLSRPTTSDGYQWFAAVTFKAKNGFIVSAFPQKKDGRSVAFYYQGEISDKEITRVILCLAVKIPCLPLVADLPVKSK